MARRLRKPQAREEQREEPHGAARSRRTRLHPEPARTAPPCRCARLAAPGPLPRDLQRRRHRPPLRPRPIRRGLLGPEERAGAAASDTCVSGTREMAGSARRGSGRERRRASAAGAHLQRVAGTAGETRRLLEFRTALVGGFFGFEPCSWPSVPRAGPTSPFRRWAGKVPTTPSSASWENTQRYCGSYGQAQVFHLACF